jgi:hypothetical protein
LACLSVARAEATSCGTVAAPTPCAITVGGQVTYTFSNFSLPASNAQGGGNVYSGADIDIDVATSGGLTALLTFEKGTASQGNVFFANAGQSSSFTVSYTVAITPAVPGSVSYASPFVVDFGQSSHPGNGLATAQLIIANVTSCQAITGGGPANCAFPSPQPLSLNAGTIANLAGNAANVTFDSYSNLFDATFTAGVPVGEVPTLSPWSLALLALLLGAAAFVALRRQGTSSPAR